MKKPKEQPINHEYLFPVSNYEDGCALCGRKAIEHSWKCEKHQLLGNGANYHRDNCK